MEGFKGKLIQSLFQLMIKNINSFLETLNDYFINDLTPGDKMISGAARIKLEEAAEILKSTKAYKGEYA